MKAKTEPATTRIMRLLDRLSAYSFNLYYVKGRDIILSDFLSRHRQKDLDPSELIPISFCCLKVYRSFIGDRIGEDIFCIKTRSSAKASGEQVGEVHGANKSLDPNYKPEHQSKSKLLSVTGKYSPVKTPRKPILRTPVRPTPKVQMTPKCTIPFPVIVLLFMSYTCNILPHNFNSTKLHHQGIAHRSQYSGHTPEAVTLQ